jgi:hypothetical protein
MPNHTSFLLSFIQKAPQNRTLYYNEEPAFYLIYIKDNF